MRIKNKIRFFILIALFCFPNLLIQIEWNIGIANVNMKMDGNISFNPIVLQKKGLDCNSNKIQDELEDKIIKNLEDEITVITTFSEPITPDLERKISQIGGEIKSKWSIIYGAAITIQANAIYSLASLSELNFIRENELCKTHLSTTTRQINVRPYVWEALELEGNPEHTIAILDSGADESHPDLAGKIAHWEDFIGEKWNEDDDLYSEPIDILGHGTHCASIACGSGNAGGNKDYVTVSRIFYFPNAVPEDYGIPYYFETENYGNVTMEIIWNDVSGNDPDDTLFVTLDINGDDAANMTEDLHVYGDYKDGPLKLNCSTLPPGKHRYLIGQKEDSEIGPSIVQLNVTRPASVIDDGKNKYRGVAPNCNIVAVKVIDDSGIGDVDTIISGIDWVAEYCEDLNIVACSLSLGFEGEISEIDAALNNLVYNGVVCTVSAGNSFLDDFTIGSPAIANRAITVGAINDVDEITYYSSNGMNFGPHTKPDVVAPGGSILRESDSYTVIAADSNDYDYIDASEIEDLTGVEKYLNPEKNFDDYIAKQGTSMSCPHVAGIAALIIQAMGNKWSYSLENAMKVKNLICGTATEVLKGEQVEDYYNLPTEDRGEKDKTEGWGKVHANAAIDAFLTNCIIGSENTLELSDEPLNDQCWARKITMEKKSALKFDLVVPSTADYDLYLYDLGTNFGETSEGFTTKSIMNGKSEDESFTFNSRKSKTMYVVIKCVEGYGQATLTVSTVSYTANLPILFVLIISVLGLASLNFSTRKKVD